MQTRSQTNSERKYFNVLAAKKKHKFLRTTSFEDNSVLRTSLSVGRFAEGRRPGVKRNNDVERSSVRDSSASPDHKIFDFQERRCKVEGLFRKSSIFKKGPPTIGVSTLVESLHTTNIEENYCDKLRNRKKIYDVDIDFDEASKAWLQNKKKTGDGCYTYK